MKQSAIHDVLIERVRKNREALIRRLERNIRWDGDCAIWTGAKGQNNPRNGYGRINFWYGGKHVQFSAHAVFMTLMLKAPIPDDKEVDHICDRRDCVRHLQLVTRQGNLEKRDQRQKAKTRGRG